MLRRSTPLAALLGAATLVPAAAATGGPARGAQSEGSGAALPSMPAPSPSGGEIVPQRGIRGVRLGMAPQDVRAVLGAPESTATVRLPPVGAVRVWRYRGLRVTFDSIAAARTVMTVTTTTRADHTLTGVGVGSTEAEVRAGVRATRCWTDLGYRRCTVGSAKAGATVTDFSISTTGRVTRVTLTRVLD